MKRNMFIVSFEGPDDKNLPCANGIRQILDNELKPYSSGIKLQVEDGGHKEIAKLVCDYLDAEEVLEKFESMNGIVGFVGQCDLNYEIGHKWKALYDNVCAKRTTLVSKLRQYGATI